MSDAERSRRHRAKASGQGSQRTTPEPDLLAGSPEAIAERIRRVSVDMARGIAMALQQRLLQGGCWPLWRLPMM